MTRYKVEWVNVLGFGITTGYIATMVWTIVQMTNVKVNFKDFCKYEENGKTYDGTDPLLLNMWISLWTSTTLYLYILGCVTFVMKQYKTVLGPAIAVHVGTSLIGSFSVWMCREWEYEKACLWENTTFKVWMIYALFIPVLTGVGIVSVTTFELLKTAYPYLKFLKFISIVKPGLPVYNESPRCTTK